MAGVVSATPTYIKKVNMKNKTYTSPMSVRITTIPTSMLCSSLGTTDENVDNSDKSGSRPWDSGIWNELEEEE